MILLNEASFLGFLGAPGSWSKQRQALSLRHRLRHFITHQAFNIYIQLTDKVGMALIFSREGNHTKIS